MKKQKRKAKEGIQVGLFEQEMLKPVDLHEEPPSDITVEEKTVEIDGKQVPYAEAHLYRPIVSLDAWSCPICGQDTKLMPSGIMKCTECWWWQGITEAINYRAG